MQLPNQHRKIKLSVSRQYSKLTKEGPVKLFVSIFQGLMVGVENSKYGNDIHKAKSLNQ